MLQFSHTVIVLFILLICIFVGMLVWDIICVYGPKLRECIRAWVDFVRSKPWNGD